LLTIKATEKQENRSYLSHWTPAYVNPYNTLPTNSTFHHDQTKTETYGGQQHYSQNRCSERSSTTGAIVLDTMEQVIRLNGATKAPPNDHKQLHPQQKIPMQLALPIQIVLFLPVYYEP